MKTVIALALLIQASSGPLFFAHADYQWSDSARHREIAVRVWTPPISDPRPRPIVVFAPAAGTLTSFYAAKIQDLASHGFIVIAADSPEMPRCPTPLAGIPYDE